MWLDLKLQIFLILIPTLSLQSACMDTMAVYTGEKTYPLIKQSPFQICSRINRMYKYSIQHTWKTTSSESYKIKKIHHHNKCSIYRHHNSMKIHLFQFRHIKRSYYQKIKERQKIDSNIYQISRCCFPSLVASDG